MAMPTATAGRDVEVNAMKRVLPLLAVVLGFLSALSVQAHAQHMTISAPAEMGMSHDRLELLGRAFTERAARGEAPGYVIMVARRGQLVFSRAIGVHTLSPRSAMEIDTKFRIASMTKPVMAVAALTLIEQGRLSLSDPVKKYLPEFAAMQVREADGAMTPQKRDMTIRDLMIHTSGIGYRFDTTTEIGKAYASAAPYENARTLKEASEIIARQPLYFQPGERFFYSYGFDVLGRVIEVITGESLEAYLARTIFRPLRMHDTSFTVNERERSSLASVYSRRDGVLQRMPGTVFGDPFDPQTWPSGGAGLISTAQDYLRFASMLERGGTLDGVQVISPASIALMTSNHFPQAIRERAAQGPLAGLAMGLGVAVVEDIGRTGALGAAGDFAWGGHYDTQFFVSPRYEIAAVILSQVQPTPGAPDSTTMRDFKSMVLAAVQE